MIIFFDLDSTLVDIEGLDEMARWKGIGPEIEEITHKTMSGDMDFTMTLPSKIAAISPSKNDLERLGEIYISRVVNGLDQLFREFKKQKIKYGIITGNLNPAPQIFGYNLGIDKAQIFTNDIELDMYGNFKSFNTEQILAKDDGKKIMIEKLKSQMPGEKIIYVGDSVSDLMTQGVADKFIGFGGVVEREKVKQNAKYYVYSILDIIDLI